MIKTSIRVKTHQRNTIGIGVRTRAAEPYNNDFPVWLQNDIVALGLGVAKSRFHAASIGEGLVQAAVGVKAGRDEGDGEIIMDDRSGCHNLAIRLKSDGR